METLTHIFNIIRDIFAVIGLLVVIILAIAAIEGMFGDRDNHWPHG